jgi:radical SAM protein with 4Fe4S-binding SPASM domain
MSKLRRAPRRITEEDKQNPKPIYVVWETTMRCDHACSHCGSRAEFSRPDELKTKELFEVADQLIRIGTREVTLIGGEAYLRSDVYELVEYLTKAGIYVAIQTGGLGLTNRRIDKLKKAGLRGIGVSIDGPADVHDVLRGRVGSWEAGMDSIRRAQEAGFNITSNTQVNQLTVGRLRETAYAIKDAGVKVWRIQLTVPMGRAADRPEWLLQPWQILQVIDEMAEIKTEILMDAYERGIPPHKVMNVTMGNNVGYYGQHEHLLRSSPGVVAKAWHGCQAGKYTLGIESDGQIKGCPSLPTAPYIGGNIRNVTLDELWATPEISFVRNRTTEELWGHCKSCYYAEVCRAGCSFTTHCFLGKRGNNPLCYYRADKLKKNGRRERFIQVEKAEGLPYDFGRFELIEEDWPIGST